MSAIRTKPHTLPLRQRRLRALARWLILLTASQLAMTALVGAEPAHAIAKGENVADNQYRFSVRLTMFGIPTVDHGERESFCSGALIAPRWVITAGHCFRNALGVRVNHTVAERTTATIGRTDLDGSAGHETTVTVVHQSPTADVALARLDTAIADIEPLRVAANAPAVGDIARLTGYGLTSESKPTSRLQTGQFVVSSVGDSQIGMTGVAPHRETSPCLHDSGGPYFTRQPDGRAVLVAVVSRGPACPHAGPDMGARVDNIAGWISATIAADTVGAYRRTLAGVPAWAALPILLTLFLGALVGVLTRGRRRRLASGSEVVIVPADPARQQWR